MYRRLVFLSWIVTSTLSGQAPEIPTEAKRYHDLLKRRPQAGTLFDRFHDAWLESASADSLLEFLKSQATRSDATASDHRLLALLQSRRGQDADALLSLEAALKLTPKDAEAWFEKSQLQARALDFEAALQSLKQAMEAGPKDLLRVEIAREQGKFLLRLNRTSEALQTWLELTKQNPDDLDLSEDVIEIMAEEGLYTEAADEAQHLVELTRNASEKLTRQLRWADLLLRAEKRDESLKVLDTSLAQSGQDSWVEADVLARFDQLYRREDDLDGLKARLETLSKTYPQRAQLGKAYANTLAELGESKTAAEYFRELLSRNPGKRSLQEDYIALLERMELISEAAAQAKILSDQYPDDKELLIKLAGLQHRQTGNDSTAQATLELYLSKSQVNGSTPENDLLRVARLLENWELDSAARKAFENLATTYPQSISAQEALAHHLHRAKDDQSALKIWKELSKSPQMEDVLRVGQALLSHGHTTEAEAMLSEREAEFAKDPRFLSLLAQLALTNKNFDKAVRLARARLSAFSDAANLHEAVKFASQAIHAAQTTDQVITELQESLTSLTVPDRCLLSQLLEEAGNEEMAITVLEAPQAPPEEQLTLGIQRVRVLESRQDFEQAVKTLALIMQLPGGLTSDHTRQAAKLYRRIHDFDKAIAAITEWKKLSPGAVQPWIEEAGILMEQAKQSAALDILRTASRKFSENREVMESLANELAMAGKTQEAYSAYMALYEQTEDPIARLRFLQPLAQMSSVTGGLPRLLEQFQKRQRQNRASALPWLALAAIHAATNNEEERRRCLYEASRLRPKDLALLTEIARIEEQSGLYPEALRTLQSAAVLDKTQGTKTKLASLLIETGDEEAGYQMMFELAGIAQADARAIEKMADTLAANGRWDRVIGLLQPLLPRFSNDYRLHYLHAVALEEEGRENEAIAAFIHLLSMHEELAIVAAAPSATNVTQLQTYSGDIPDLPEGTAEWLKLPQVARTAYMHRQKQRGYSGQPWATSFTFSSPILSNGWVQQPTNVTNLSAMALYHLVEIGQGMKADEKSALVNRMEAAGIRDCSLLLEIPLYEGSFGIPADLLEDHPNHAALHALWLMHLNQFQGDLLPGLQRCMELFKNRYPHLAFQSAMSAIRFSEEGATQLIDEGLDLGEAQPRATNMTMNTLLSALVMQSRPNSGNLVPQAVQDRMIALALKWSSELLDQGDASQNLWSAYSLIGLLGNFQKWDAIPELLEHENARQLKILSAQPQNSVSYGAVYLQAQPITPIWRQAGVSPNIATVILQLGLTQNNYRGRGSYVRQKNSPEIEKGLQLVLAGLTTPSLKLMVQVRLGADSDEVKAAFKGILSDPSVTSDDWIFAAWVAQQIEDWPQVISWLHEASLRGPAPNTQKMIDNAIFMAAQRSKGELSTLNEQALRQAFARAKTSNLGGQQHSQLVTVAMSTGLKDELDLLKQASAKPNAQRRSQSRGNPYSRQYASTRQSNSSMIEKMLSKGSSEAAFKEFRRSVIAIGQTWLSPNWGNAMSMTQELRRVIDQHQVTARFIEQLRASPKTSWKELQERAAFLELISQHEAAIETYSQAIAIFPKAWDARARLAVLLAASDADQALTHLRAIPSFEMRHIFQRLNYELGSSSGKEHVFEEKLALVRLISSYITQNLDPKRRIDPSIAGILTQMPQQIQQGEHNEIRFPGLYDENPEQSLDATAQQARARLREAYDSFCLSLTQVPMLSLSGFGPYAGLCLQNGEPLEKLESLALEVLDRQALVRRYTPSLGYWFGFSRNRYASQDGQISLPQPEDILIRLYMQTNRQDEIDHKLLPLIKKAYGESVERQARAYARLYQCAEAEFVNAAQSWVQSQITGMDPGCGSEISRIWALRKIRHPIHEIYLTRIQDPNLAVQNSDLRNYLLTLHKAGRSEDAQEFLKQARNLWLGEKREERDKVLNEYIEQQSPNRHSYRWMGYGYDNSATAVNAYLGLLREMMEHGPSLLAVRFAKEDGLLDHPFILNQFSYSISNSAQFQNSTAHIIEVMEALDILAPANTFRVWKSQENSSETLLQRFIANQNGEALPSFIKALKERQPMDFGTALVLAMLSSDSKERLQEIHGFLKRHGKELPQLSEKACFELNAFLRQQIPGFPWNLDSEAAQMIGPLNQAERAKSRALAERVLSAKAWEETLLQPYDARNLLPSVIQDVAQDDHQKAKRLFEQTVDLLKGTQEQMQSTAPASGPVYELFTSMGLAPALMNDVLALAKSEGLPPEWLDQYGYSIIRSDLLQRTDHVLALFRGTPFVADAEDFSPVPISRNGGSLLSQILSNLRGNQRYLTTSEKLMASLHERQTKTFGEELSLVLMTGLNKDLELFIRNRAVDFPKLPASEATNLLEVFISKDSKYNSPTLIDEEIQKALGPLFQARDQLDLATLKMLMEAPSLGDTGRSLGSIQELAIKLKRIALAYPDQTLQLFEKLTLLIASEDRRQNSSSHPADSATGDWLRQCALIPELFSIALKRAENEGILDHGSWLRSVSQNLNHAENFANSQTAIRFIKHSPFLADLENFRSYAIQNDSRGSCFGYLTDYIRSQKERLPEVITWLNEQSASFGRDLLLILVEAKPKSELLKLLQKHESSIGKLSPEQQKEFGVFIESLLSPLEVYVQDIAALQPLLQAQRLWATDAQKTLLAIQDIETLQRSYSARDQLATVLAKIARHTPDEAKAVLHHILMLYDGESRGSNQRDPAYTSSAVFLASLKRDPALWPLMSETAVERKLHQNKNWQQQAACMSYFYSSPMDSRLMADALMRSGLFQDAPRFNPLTGLGDPGHLSLLQTLSERLPRSSTAKQIQEVIQTKHTETFGADLIQTIFARDRDDALNQFAVKHAADFQQLTPETQSILLASVQNRWPSLDQSETLPESIQEGLKPWIEIRERNKAEFEKNILNGSTFEAYKLTEVAFTEECKKLILSTLDQRDEAKAITLFRKAVEIIETRQKTTGWKLHRVTDGWTLSSLYVQQWLTAKDLKTLAFGLKLFNSDQTGQLLHSGWNPDYGWGTLLFQTWRDHKSLANPVYAMEETLKELAAAIQEQPTALLHLAFHQMAQRMQKSDLQLLNKWATHLSEDSLIYPLAQEFLIASRLFLESSPDGVSRDDACVLAADESQKNLWQHLCQIIENDTLPAQVRIALGHHLCMTYPWTVPADVTMAMAKLVAAENLTQHAVKTSTVAAVIRCMRQVPITDEWRQSAEALWEGWIKRQPPNKTNTSSSFGYGNNYLQIFAMLQLAGQLQRDEWIQILLDQASYLKQNRSTIAVLVYAGYPKMAADLLQKHAQEMTAWQSGIYTWHPDMRAHLPAFLANCQDPGLALIGELIVLQASDPPPQILRSLKEKQTLAERIGSLAPKVLTTTFSDENLRLHAASIIANYASPQAVEQLGELCSHAVEKTSIQQIADMRNSGDRALAAYIRATHITEQAIKGNSAPWLNMFNPIEGYNYEYANIATLISQYVADQIADQWEKGQAQDSTQWLPLVEKMLLLTERQQYPENLVGMAYTMATQSPGGISKWKASLPSEQRYKAERSLRSFSRIFEKAEALAGKPDSPHRFSDEKRLSMILDLLKDRHFNNALDLITNLIHKHQLLTEKEALTHGIEIHNSGPKNMDRFQQIVNCAINKKLFTEALQLFDGLQESLSDYDPVSTKFLKIQVLIRVGDKTQASALLNEIITSNPTPKQKEDAEELLRILERPSS